MINLINSKTNSKMTYINKLLDDNIITNDLYEKLKHDIQHDFNLGFFYAVHKI